MKLNETKESELQKRIAITCEEIISIGKLLYDKGYNSGKDGNISARVDDEHILITASGALLGFLEKQDVVLVDKDGNPVNKNSSKKPSSEIAMHTGIYKERNDINAVIHAHAPYCISLSMLDVETENDLYLVSSGPVPITEIALPSTPETWEKIKPFVKTRSKAILKRHGAVSWGKNLMNAFVKLEETETFAKCLVNAMAVKKIEPLSKEIKTKLFTLWRTK